MRPISKWFRIVPTVCYILLSFLAAYDLIFHYRWSYDWVYALVIAIIFCLQLKFNHIAVGRVMGLLLVIASIVFFISSLPILFGDEDTSTTGYIIGFGLSAVNFVIAVSFFAYYVTHKVR